MKQKLKTYCPNDSLLWFMLPESWILGECPCGGVHGVLDHVRQVGHRDVPPTQHEYQVLRHQFFS